MYLLYVRVGLWLEVVVCHPAGRMEKVKEVVEVHGCVHGCPPQMVVFCAGSCASVVALEHHHHLYGMAH